MDIAGLRDLVIIIWGLASVVVILILAVILVACYRHLKPIFSNAEAASANIARLSDIAREAAAPLSQVAVLIQVISKVLEAIRGSNNKGKEVEHD